MSPTPSLEQEHKADSGYQADALDTENFDPEFTRETPQDSVVEGGQILSETMQNQFAGFSYNRPIAGLGDAGGSLHDPSFVGSMQGSMR